MHSPFDMLVYETMKSGDAKSDDARAPQAAAPVRTTLRSLLRRLGETTAPATSAHPHGFDLVLEAPRPEPVDAADPRPDEDAGAPALASPFETRVQMLRANAHAAYRCVQGPPEVALNAALAVIEAEWRGARLRALRHGEALKHIRPIPSTTRAGARPGTRWRRLTPRWPRPHPSGGFRSTGSASAGVAVMPDAALQRNRRNGASRSLARQAGENAAPGVLPAILMGCLGAVASAALTLSAGGSALLAALAYSLGGSLILLACSATGALRPSISIRLPAILRPQQMVFFGRRTHFG